MTHKAVLLVTRLLQNRDLLECSTMAEFREDEEGYVQWIVLPKYKIRMYEKPDQGHGVVYKFEFHEGKRPYFTVLDYLRGDGEQVSYLKKDTNLQESKMDAIIGGIEKILDDTVNSVPYIGRYLAGAN